MLRSGTLLKYADFIAQATLFYQALCEAIMFITTYNKISLIIYNLLDVYIRIKVDIDEIYKCK